MNSRDKYIVVFLGPSRLIPDRTSIKEQESECVFKQASISMRSKTVVPKVRCTAPRGRQGALEESPAEGIVHFVRLM
jgi:hypothetical protein